MVERTVVGAAVMGIVAFLTFRWLLPETPDDADVATARNALLMLMVLFENIHIGNCRSETRSALFFAPWRSPLLLIGAATAFLVHLAMLYVPFGRSLLGTQPLDGQQWVTLLLLALTIFPAMEAHKWLWYLRHRNRADAPAAPFQSRRS
jgi:magnesium-transporting ATPase (P-type)